jgi:cysteine-S-conjugate beta-lyase
MFKLAKADTLQKYAETVRIRYKVFILEQKVPEKLEIEFEDDCAHFLALEGNVPVGCVRVRKVGKKLKIERLAILKEFRGKGFGREIVKKVVGYCRKKRSAGIYMNAQYYLLDFYRGLGFVPEGKTFMEAGIKHVRMRLATSKSSGTD